MILIKNSFSLMNKLKLFTWLSLLILFIGCSKNIEKRDNQEPSVEVSEGLAFGSVLVNSTSIKSISIKNTGKKTLAIHDIYCTEGFSASWIKGEINPGETKIVQIKFSPILSKIYIGQVTIVSDAISGIDVVSVNGAGVSATATLSIDRTDIPFGDVEVASTKTENFVIKNTGTSPLTITNILTSDKYIFNGSFNNTTIPVGGSETVTVWFTPYKGQSYTGTFEVKTNAGSKIVSFTGRGISIYDIYVSGYEYISGSSTATYWENGNPVRLAYGEVAKSIFVSATDVYTAGSKNDKYPNPSAYYWKNSSSTTLVNGDLSAYSSYGTANSIAVDGGNVYVAGYKADDGVSSPYATYWKNGVSPIILTKASEGTGIAYGITVYNGTPYTCGRVGNFAKYWVGGYGGYAYSLTNGNTAAQASSITVVNSTVYTAGYEDNSAGKRVAKYWRNTIAYPLTDGARDAQATSIFVDGNDIYVAGQELNSTGISVAKYWKNGAEVILGNGLQNSYAWAITVIDGKAFVGGEQRGAGVREDAVFWKNGNAPIYVTNGNSVGGSLRAIFVKKR